MDDSPKYGVSFIADAPPTPAPLADGTISVLKLYERAATPGKWRILFDIEDDKVTDKHIGIENEGGCLVIRDDWGFATQEDFEFICAMRNALPGLLARLAAAEADQWTPTTDVARRPAMLKDEFYAQHAGTDEEENAAILSSANVLAGWWATGSEGPYWVINTARYYAQGERWFEAETGARIYPTHWQPMPAPPAKGTSNV